MTARSDGNPESLSRERLCLLAGVERGRHHRWIQDGLLPRKALYAEIDVVKAAALDELWDVLKPSAAKVVWPQIAGELGIADASLEVVVRLADLAPHLVRSPDELARVLPRGERVVVVSLHDRVREARKRLRAFRARQFGAEAMASDRPAGEQPDTAVVPATQSVLRP